MSITVLYFAAVRQRLGEDRKELDLPATATIAGVWTASTGEPWQGQALAAINQEYARSEDPVRDGDEVAFFPPVTGG